MAGRGNDKFSICLTLRRHVSNAELSNILRPFYFAVHPDLFGQHPEQRVYTIPCLRHTEQPMLIFKIRSYFLEYKRRVAKTSQRLH